jgi:type I restriction enzyme R subunit
MRPSWKIVPYRAGLETSKLDCVAVEEYPTQNGPADYALFVRGQFLGIIEAKKVSVNPQNVLEQAKLVRLGRNRWAGQLEWLSGAFLYATNGELVWHLDTRDNKHISRQLSGFSYSLSTDGTLQAS